MNDNQNYQNNQNSFGSIKIKKNIDMNGNQNYQNNQNFF